MAGPFKYLGGDARIVKIEYADVVRALAVRAENAATGLEDAADTATEQAGIATAAASTATGAASTATTQAGIATDAAAAAVAAAEGIPDIEELTDIVTLGDTQTLTGEKNFTGGIKIGGVTFTPSSYVGKATLDADGAVAKTGAQTIAGAKTFSNAMTVNSSLYVLTTFTVASTLNANGNLILAGNQTVGGAVTITGHSSVSTLTSTSNVAVGGTLAVTGVATFTANPVIGGISFSPGNYVAKAGAETLTGKKHFEGQATVKDRLIVSSSQANAVELEDAGSPDLGNLLQINAGTDYNGLGCFKWGNDAKGTTFYFVKSRGAGMNDFTPVQEGDRVHTNYYQGATDVVNGYSGHIGLEEWSIDKDPNIPTVVGEAAGRWSLRVGTGLHSGGVSPTYPFRFGVMDGICINSRLQTMLPGFSGFIYPEPNSDFGGILRFGPNRDAPGEAVLKFTLQNALLLDTAEAGAYEVDEDGHHYITDANEDRHRLLTTKDKFGGSAVTIASTGTGAGTGASASVAGNAQGGRITLTTGSSPAVDATILTATFAAAFPADAFVVISPGNAATATLVRSVSVAPNASGFVLSNSLAALSASTQYVWNYIVVGK